MKLSTTILVTLFSSFARGQNWNCINDDRTGDNGACIPDNWKQGDKRNQCSWNYPCANPGNGCYPYADGTWAHCGPYVPNP
ncbi:unnamed protein product [Cercospora beticola]|nr:unnamed protein product [Cercospora beticola]